MRCLVPCLTTLPPLTDLHWLHPDARRCGYRRGQLLHHRSDPHLGHVRQGSEVHYAGRLLLRHPYWKVRREMGCGGEDSMVAGGQERRGYRVGRDRTESLVLLAKKVRLVEKRQVRPRSC